MEFAVQSNVIRHLSKEQYQTLRELCQLSNNLYNVALYNIRQYFFSQKLFLNREYRKVHPSMEDILIPYPDRLNGAELKEVRICPYDNGRYFKIQYVYHWYKEETLVNPDNIMAIDLGVENLAACTSNVETPFIIDGRKLKSINQYWNKEKARLQSIAMKQGQRTTHRINRITIKRNNQVKDIIKKSVRYIINNCIENQMGTLIVGYNKDFKRSVNIGKINNQNFVQIPLEDFRQQLKFLCWTYGIEYIEQEESYTSKSSFIDNDILPEYKAEHPYLGKFSGKRVHRGLYQSKDGIVINADVNGSANIGRKCKQNFSIEELSSGLLASPKRIRVA